MQLLKTKNDILIISGFHNIENACKEKSSKEVGRFQNVLDVKVTFKKGIHYP